VKQSSFPSFRTQTHRDQDNHKQAERHDDVLGGSLEAGVRQRSPREVEEHTCVNPFPQAQKSGAR
jgi:hypothetical protein